MTEEERLAYIERIEAQLDRACRVVAALPQWMHDLEERRQKAYYEEISRKLSLKKNERSMD